MQGNSTKIYNSLISFFLTVLFVGTSYAQKSASGDSIKIAIAPEYNAVGKSHRFFLGENYRKLWAMPVPMRILDFSKEHGGLTILKLGGGMQTRSLRLKDSSGKEWVLRTIQKYPERGLAENLKPTIARDIVQDQVSTGHPFGALVAPSLAEALGLLHSNPEIVYVGNDPGLGEYQKDFANAAYLFEERNPFETEKTDATDKAQRKVQNDNDTNFDEKLTLRARLLDMVIGDWDRHEDNWRWLPEKSKGETIYRPIPRDRDKVFYKTSGLLPWFLSHQWLKSNLQPYSENIRDVKGYNFNARYLDRYFLNQLDEGDWKEEIKYIQDRLTSELIDSTMKFLPDSVYADPSTAELTRSLKGRVKNLPVYALEYFRFLAGIVEIPASDKKEFFDIRHTKKGDIDLTIFNIRKDGSNGRKIYHRKFDHHITKEIRLYGFGGEDVFSINGTTKSSIKVRMVGGDDVDKFEVDENLKNKHKLYVYDRSDQENILPAPSLARLRLATDTAVNQYNKRSFLFDRLGPLFRINYNIDQGIQIGAGLVFEKQGFRKVPYAFKNEFWANYSTGRKSFILDYVGDFKKVFGLNDMEIDAHLLGPNNLSNFFGIGNNTRFINKGNRKMPYYRNRYDYLTADFKLKRKIRDNLTLFGGVSTEYYTSKQTNNLTRFLFDFNEANPQYQVFQDRVYAGLIAGWTYDSRDNISMPSKGLYWNTTFSAKEKLNGFSQSYGKLATEIRYYLSSKNSNFVMANRLGGGTTVGDPTFFQKMQLGGVRSLRGYHTNRFTGKTMMYHNLDLRMDILHFTSYIVPGTLGIIGFNDVGRVWEPDQSSKKWHDGYGGGLYVVPAELVLIQFVMGFSKEGSLPYISIGFSF
ncbi:BamA/TamA family outer membrane protein [Dyadobacter subterraneus]|uniref:BamA/TamA family outer membrane protein n=1 Tax=Dyadobacter subterraneus TaxID=2773304 RepID=A0ABR9WID4_9BACT|nr:BamA/TamA family outer membrane protein [Dyadobacter subterraneus]MBE9464641.1 BamA/TamA family outer membrane protein [Dyadobacter subterraneus]